MSTQRFMVDNNALTFLGERRRRSVTFRERCRIPEDVLREAEGAPDHASLLSLAFAVTPSVLRYVRRVMATIPLGNTELIDLYGYKGTADPVLVASALAALDQEALTLLPDRWSIVTLDKAVLATAAAFGVHTTTPTELAHLIDASV
ncbi:MAG: hypothetical protein JWR55_249 [Aeromicrobium sp.]|jgi:hypothetical protein|nr:hypothetical protein [Aeromicrobium sp.]